MCLSGGGGWKRELEVSYIFLREERGGGNLKEGGGRIFLIRIARVVGGRKCKYFIQHCIEGDAASFVVAMGC